MQSLLEKTRDNTKDLLALCTTDSLPLVFYGSLCSGTQTFTSDVDVRVLSTDQNLPSRLYTILAGTVASQASLREGDRVGPSCNFANDEGFVLTYVDKTTGISVDISFGINDPSNEFTLLNRWMKEYPLFRDTLLLFKMFLEVCTHFIV